MKRLALTIVFLLGFAPSAWADFQAGVDAYNRGDYATAHRELRPLAEQGDAFAQFLLATMYYYGRAVPQDFVKAVRWLREAAEQGDADAQFNLGVMYFNGQSVPQDYLQAHKWYNLAASRLPPGEYRDRAVKNRDDAAARMTAGQIAEAQRLAREWKPTKE